MDAAFYGIQGQGKAVEYDGGLHTKHRHMRYHDFFVARIYPGERVLDIRMITKRVLPPRLRAGLGTSLIKDERQINSFPSTFTARFLPNDRILGTRGICRDSELRS